MFADKGTYRNFSEYVPIVEAMGTGLIQLAMEHTEENDGAL